MFGKAIVRGLLAVALVSGVVVVAQAVTSNGARGQSGQRRGMVRPEHGGYGADRICGAVGYTYNIGKYEVTAGQYTEFLNAVAKTDTYGLYNTNMWSSTYGCKIQQSGSSGSYTYSVASDYANRPVNYVAPGATLPVRQLAAQRPADRRAGASVDHRGRGVHSERRNGRTATLLAVTATPMEVGGHQRGRVVQGGLLQGRRHQCRVLGLPDEQQHGAGAGHGRRLGQQRQLLR